jgi:hypothetical protein
MLKIFRTRRPLQRKTLARSFPPPNMLLGHTKATTTAIYGNVPKGILRECVKMIEAVKYGLSNHNLLPRVR